MEFVIDSELSQRADGSDGGTQYHGKTGYFRGQDKKRNYEKMGFYHGSTHDGQEKRSR